MSMLTAPSSAARELPHSHSEGNEDQSRMNIVSSGQLVSANALDNVEASLYPSIDIWTAVGMTALAALLFGLRIFLLYPPEIGGDAVSNWYASQALLDGQVHTPLRLSFSRLGIQIPTALFIGLFGAYPWVYHLVPTIFSLISGFCVLLLVRRFSNPFIAFFAGLLFAGFPELSRNSIQLLPGIFECTYLALTALMTVRYLEKKLLRDLVLAAVFLFLGYMSKFTFGFVGLGMLFVFWRNKVKLNHLGVFFGILFVCYVLEHAFFATHGWIGGRFHMLMGETSITSGEPEYRALWEIHSFSDFFNRYSFKMLRQNWWALYMFAIPVGAVAMFMRDGRLQALAFLIFGRLFLDTFMVQSLDPLMTITRPIRRYNTIYAALFVTIAVAGSYVIISSLLKLLASRVPLVNRWTQVRTVLASTLVVAALFPMYQVFWKSTLAIAKDRNQALLAGNHPTAKEPYMWSLMNDNIQMGIPVIFNVTSVDGRGASLKQLRAAEGLFLSYEHKGGAAPDPNLRKEITVQGQELIVLWKGSREELVSWFEKASPQDPVGWIAKSAFTDILSLPLGEALVRRE